MLGTGTQADPYIIENVSDLQNMNNDLSAYYELGGNIDASDTINWNGGAGFVPVGDNNVNFTGSFDGKNYEITDLYINRPTGQYQALFGYVNGGTVKNIKLSADVTTNGRGGVLGGWCYNSTFDNCETSGIVNGIFRTGGFAYGFSSCTVNNCINNADISVSGNQDTVSYIGGFSAGIFNGSSVTNCYNFGDITLDTSFSSFYYLRLGSFTGHIGGSSSDITIVEKCYADADITILDETHNGVAGFSGYIDYYSTVEQCGVRLIGTLKGKRYIGGFVGLGRVEISDCYSIVDIEGVEDVGGFVGYGNAKNYYNCYCVGDVSGTEDYNAFGGTQAYYHSNNCYYDSDVCSITDSKATGLTTTQMKDIVNFTNWDFTTLWEEDTENKNNGYHILQGIDYPSSSVGYTENLNVNLINYLDIIENYISAGMSYEDILNVVNANRILQIDNITGREELSVLMLNFCYIDTLQHFEEKLKLNESNNVIILDPSNLAEVIKIRAPNEILTEVIIVFNDILNIKNLFETKLIDYKFSNEIIEIIDNEISELIDYCYHNEECSVVDDNSIRVFTKLMTSETLMTEDNVGINIATSLFMKEINFIIDSNIITAEDIKKAIDLLIIKETIFVDVFEKLKKEFREILKVQDLVSIGVRDIAYLIENISDLQFQFVDIEDKKVIDEVLKVKDIITLTVIDDIVLALREILSVSQGNEIELLDKVDAVENILVGLINDLNIYDRKTIEEELKISIDLILELIEDLNLKENIGVENKANVNLIDSWKAIEKLSIGFNNLVELLAVFYGDYEEELEVKLLQLVEVVSGLPFFSSLTGINKVVVYESNNVTVFIDTENKIEIKVDINTVEMIFSLNEVVMEIADFIIKENDTSPSIKAVLRDAEGNPVDLSGAEVYFHMTDYPAERILIDKKAEIEDPKEGVVVHHWLEGDTKTPGRYKGEWEVHYQNGSIETFPNSYNLEIRIFEELA